WEKIRGIDPSEVDAGARRKSISSERTFFADVHDDEELEQRLLKLCCSVGRQLRTKELRARTVTVKLRDFDFTTRQASTTQPEGIETDHALYALAGGLLRQLRARRPAGVRLLGVGVSTLVRQAVGRQLPLFEDGTSLETERDRTLSRAVDRVRDRFGHEALSPGSVLGSRDRRIDG
ncbi:MAG: DNA polymerase IV, partial [Gemmatimonadetes bacterium]|nr:DNA polymerase IV [Gemmatimonadota bacterium]